MLPRITTALHTKQEKYLLFASKLQNMTDVSLTNAKTGNIISLSLF